MRKRYYILAGAGVLAVVTAVALRWADREPQFHGRVLSAWVSDLRKGTGEEKARAAEVLREAGPGAAPLLAARLGRKPGVLERLNARFGRSIPQVFKKPLRRVFDPGRQIMDQYAAADALRVIGTNGQDAVPALGELLESPNHLLSISASRALAQMGPSAAGPLTRALDHPDFNVRAAACEGLGQLGTNAAAAAPRLARILQGEVGPIASSAAYALSRIGEPSVAVLLPLLKDTNWGVRRQAVYSLAYAGIAAKSAEPALLASARDEHPQVRAMAIDALGRIDPLSRESVRAAQAALEDPDASTRGAALKMLRYRPRYVRENIAQITALLQDPVAEVQGYAALALSAAPEQSRDAIPRLVELTSGTNMMVQASAREALKIIRDTLK